MKLSEAMKDALIKAASQEIAHYTHSAGIYGKSIWPRSGLRKSTLTALESRGLLTRAPEDMEDTFVLTAEGRQAVEIGYIQRRLDAAEAKAARSLARWSTGAAPGLLRMAEETQAGVARLRRIWNL